jgi:hypothetical protein
LHLPPPPAPSVSSPAPLSPHRRPPSPGAYLHRWPPSSSAALRRHPAAAVGPLLLALTATTSRHRSATAPHQSSAPVISTTCHRPPLSRTDHLHLQRLLRPVLHRACHLCLKRQRRRPPAPRPPPPGAPTARGPLARGYSEERGGEDG